MSYVSEDILQHYGVKRRSGRYPWGSGDEPYQHNSRDFLSRIEELKKQGWTETPENIKEAFGLSTTQYRTAKTIAGNERRALKVATAKSLVEDGAFAIEVMEYINKKVAEFKEEDGDVTLMGKMPKFKGYKPLPNEVCLLKLDLSNYREVELFKDLIDPICFVIKKEDLENLNFEKAYLANTLN